MRSMGLQHFLKPPYREVRGFLKPSSAVKGNRMAWGPAESSRGLKSVWHLEVWQETDTVTRQTGPLYPRPRKCRAQSAQSVGGAEVLEKRRSPWGNSAATVSLGSGLSFSPGRAPHCAPKLTSLQTMQTLSNLQRCKGLDARTLGSSTGKRGPRDTLELGAGPGTRGGARPACAGRSQVTDGAGLWGCGRKV